MRGLQVRAWACTIPTERYPTFQAKIEVDAKLLAMLGIVVQNWNNFGRELQFAFAACALAPGWQVGANKRCACLHKLEPKRLSRSSVPARTYALSRVGDGIRKDAFIVYERIQRKIYMYILLVSVL